MRSAILICTLALLAAPVQAEHARFHVLAYHDVRESVDGDIDPDQYAISTANLIDHFTWLQVNDFHPVSIDDLLAAQAGRRSLPENPVLITFDDGFKSIYTHVYPILKLFDYPAVISLVTSWIEGNPQVAQGGRQLTRDDFLTWAQIRELSHSDLIEFASHSHNMHLGVRGNPQGNLQPPAVTLEFSTAGYESIESYRARVLDDLRTSADLIEAATGYRPRVMTWPFGLYNAHTLDLAAEAGMPITMSLDDAPNDPSDLSNIARHLVDANPGVSALAYALLNEPFEPVVRAAQVDLDYVYDPDPEQQERNLGRLLDRIKAMQITHVFLQAFADPDADGGAQALYFPNRHLPMRADLFNRAAWQLRTRANVKVFAWLPLLSYSGAEIDASWRVRQQIGRKFSHDAAAEPRLSPFEPRATAIIHDIYRDLARHASIDGLLFHDDGRLNEFEDASPAALEAYREHFGTGFSIPDAGSNPAVRDEWTRLRVNALTELSLSLTEAAREFRPRIETVRNIFAPALIDDDAPDFLAQDYEEFLDAYDYVAIMAMPHLEGIEDTEAFYEKLIGRVARVPEGFRKTLFELQTIDWATGQRVPAAELRSTMRMLQSHGVRHLAYYPDDFISGRPRLQPLREGISIARYPHGAAQ